MLKKVMVTCAVTGAGDTAGRSEHVPVTPKEIADSAIKAANAGATVAHIHVRDPETGGISHKMEHYEEVVERIRESDTDVIINITAGGGGDWIPSKEDPTVGGPGTWMQTPSERHAPVEKLLPELCTLDCGSLNFGDQVYISPYGWLQEHAKMIQDAGVRPELEIFDTGQLLLAKQLMSEGLINEDPLFQFCMGIPWGMDADPETLIYLKNRLPEGAHFSAFGIGRQQFPVAMQSFLLGGHVRVGLEDNLYLEKGVLATNEQLVDKMVNIIQAAGSEPMSPDEARDFLNLRK